MKIVIESTDDVSTSVGGTPTRRWKGQTESGIPVECFIALIRVPGGRPAEDYQQFETELRACQARRELVSFDYRMVTD